MNNINAFRSRMTDEIRDMLANIYEPQAVGTPLSDAGRSLMLLPSGELREYGTIYKKTLLDPNRRKAYISSLDCGVSWTLHYDNGNMGACLYIPEKGLYIKAKAEADGTYVLRSTVGPDDPSPRKNKISDLVYFCELLPQKCEGSNRIFFTAQRKREDGINLPAFLYTDDFGDTFRITELGAPPRHEASFPHKGCRWSISNGSEPVAVDLGDGKIYMLIRTSTDYFYEVSSEDGGETFSEMRISPFHGTNTTAFLLKLSDGRILALWNNTQPLPEEDHEKQMPPLPEDIKHGYWEDVFTNRDAAHAAISEDGGKTFIGYREILLNPIRDAEDFRYAGSRASRDKSVHQFEAIELPMGKVLVSAGQNAASRRLLIFDLDWLYESERHEDFIDGMKNVSTQVYLKSIAGSTIDKCGNGHCAYNRTASVAMMPDPDGGYLDRPFIGGVHDPRRMYGPSGLCWNFPATKEGEITLTAKMLASKMRVTLSDRWFNPCDEYVGMLSPLSFDIEKSDLGADAATLCIHFSTEKKEAKVYLGGVLIRTLPLGDCLRAGLSYLLVQCGYDGEADGVYLFKLSAKQCSVTE